MYILAADWLVNVIKASIDMFIVMIVNKIAVAGEDSEFYSTLQRYVVN